MGMGASFSLRYFLRIVFDYLGIIVVSLLVINGAVIAYNLLAPRQYVASTRVFVESAGEQVMLVQKDRPFAAPPSAEQILSTESEIITSHPVVQTALSRLQGKDATAEEASAVIARLQVIPLKKSNVLRIDYQHRDATQAAKFLNLLVEAYREFRGSIAPTGQPVSKVQERLQGLRFQIDSLYSAQEALLTNSNMADFDNTMRFLSQSIFDAESRQSQIDDEMAEIRRQISYYNQELAAFRADPAHAVIVPENWVTAVRVISELQAAQDRAVTARQTFAEGSEPVKAAEQRLSQLQKQLDGVLGSHLADLKQKEQSLKAQRAQHGSRVEQQRQELLTIPEVKGRTQSIEAALENLNRLYTDLVRQQISEDVGTGGQATVSISLLSPATPPVDAAYPRRLQNVLLGLLGSLVFTISLVYILESLDTTVKTSLDFERLSIPFLSSFSKSE